MNFFRWELWFWCPQTCGSNISVKSCSAEFCLKISCLFHFWVSRKPESLIDISSQFWIWDGRHFFPSVQTYLPEVVVFISEVFVDNTTNFCNTLPDIQFFCFYLYHRKMLKTSIGKSCCCWLKRYGEGEIFFFFKPKFRVLLYFNIISLWFSSTNYFRHI